jgi:hypothetical protein
MPIVAPVSCWDHHSHKGFAPGLSKASTIELNTAQYFWKFDLILNRIRIKFETTVIDSNFMHPDASPMKLRFPPGKPTALMGRGVRQNG